MKEKKFGLLAVAAALLLQGCATTPKPSNMSLASAMALINPKYVAQAAALDTVLFGKKYSKGAAASSTDLAAARAALIAAGYVPMEVYRFKGTVCDRDDLSRERILMATDVGDAVFDPIVVSNSAPAAETDLDLEALAQSMADAFDKLSKSEGK